MAVHSEVRAEEQVSDSQEQRLGQWSSSVIIVQLICLEGVGTCMRVDPDDERHSLTFIERNYVNGKGEKVHATWKKWLSTAEMTLQHYISGCAGEKLNASSYSWNEETNLTDMHS